MAYNENSKFTKIKNNFGLVILAIAFIASCIFVFHNYVTYNDPDTQAVKICHWQLEAGFREAMAAIINDYEEQYRKRTGRKVKIIQIPVAERGYAQYINTGLIGNMAPDIIEMGHSGTLKNISNLVRYFTPLGKYLREQNRYNDGTDLQSFTWRDTFFDDLQGEITPELQEYYAIPFSMFTVRLYYNKNLLKKISGDDKFPVDYQKFINLCKAVEDYNRKNKTNYVAVAACQNQLNIFEEKYTKTFLKDLVDANDTDLNGEIEITESFHAFRDGKWNFKSPALLAKDRCLKEVSENFMAGWIAAKRDDAAFAFVQGRSLMTITGSWDAKSIIKQSEGKFEIGIADFPYPVNHPEYSKYVTGGVNEASIGAGILWALNKRSKNFEIAIDFLRYATTRKVNEKFNELTCWLPVIKGAGIKYDLLKKFKPKLEGYSGNFNFKISTEFALFSAGQKSMLLQGVFDEAEYASLLEKNYKKTMIQGFKHHMENNYRILKTYDRVMGAYIMLSEMGTAEQTDMVKDRIPTMASVAEQQSFKYSVNMHRYESFNTGEDQTSNRKESK
jgi:ABC-type glycerol-3-phosphate transport system substrate-binding protein